MIILRSRWRVSQCANKENNEFLDCEKQTSKWMFQNAESRDRWLLIVLINEYIVAINCCIGI